MPVRALARGAKESIFRPMKRSEYGSNSVLRVAEDIVPIGELKAHLSEKVRELQGRQRPFVVTQNGRAAAVLLAPEEFDRLTAQTRFVAAVEEGLADHDAGRVIADDALDRQLDKRFGARRKTAK